MSILTPGVPGLVDLKGPNPPYLRAVAASRINFFSVFFLLGHYPLPKPFPNRFQTDFEAILAPKLVQKSTPNRSKMVIRSRLRLLIDFSFKSLSCIKPANL